MRLIEQWNLCAVDMKQQTVMAVLNGKSFKSYNCINNLLFSGLKLKNKVITLNIDYEIDSNPSLLMIFSTT